MYDFALRKYDFRGRWSATPKNRGRSKKNPGRTALKSRGGILAVGGNLQRGSAPRMVRAARGVINRSASSSVRNELYTSADHQDVLNLNQAESHHAKWTHAILFSIGHEA